MSLQNKLLTLFNSNGFRWVISCLFSIVSLYKTKSKNKFKYDKINNIWRQYNGKICYYLDNKPNWNLSIPLLEKHVNNINFKQYAPKIGDVIIDVGAGVGTETIIYSLKVGLGKVYAIEAHPETFNLLKLLKDVNNFGNIIVSNFAISNERGILYIENRENHVENSVSRNNIRGLPVNSITIDEYVFLNSIKKIDFFKMNIEGAELNAIKGMTEAIKIVNYIAISCHDFLINKNSTEIKDTVIEFLLNNSFIVETQKSGHVVIDSWIYGKKVK